MLPGTTTKEDEPREASSVAEQFASTPRGAQLARRVAVRRMEEWGYARESDASCTVALIVAELAANAVRHGRLPGRDFSLRLKLDTTACLLRIELADATSTKHPPVTPPTPDPESESGRGLFLVDVLAARWGVAQRPSVGKTVWAEVALEVSALP